MGCFVYFFLGTSRDVTLGPTAIMSLLVSFYPLPRCLLQLLALIQNSGQFYNSTTMIFRILTA